MNFFNLGPLLSGVAPANQTEESEVRESRTFREGVRNLFRNPFLGGGGVLYSIYKQKGVPEPVPDSFPGSSQTSLSSVLPELLLILIGQEAVDRAPMIGVPHVRPVALNVAPMSSLNPIGQARKKHKD